MWNIGAILSVPWWRAVLDVMCSLQMMHRYYAYECMPYPHVRGKWWLRTIHVMGAYGASV
jgi:hypothetical protein